METSSVELPMPDLDDVRRIGRSVADRIEGDPRVRRFRRRRRLRRWKSRLLGRRRPPEALVTALAVVSIVTGVAAAVLGLRRR